MKKQNYINNKDLLKEIHISKLSYCSVLDAAYTQYDVIIDAENEITSEVVQTAKENQAHRLSSQAYEENMKLWHESGQQNAKPKQADFRVDPSTIDISDIVIRVMTFDHIPLNPTRKRNPKTVADHHERCNFPPFKHYAYIDNEWREVVRSHWEGGFGNGHFNTTHGNITDNLAKMMMTLCNRYSRRANWRGYSYVDEMQGNALVQLTQVGLQFNESRSLNPFAYYTRVLQNAFRRVLNLEKRNQDIRDDILQDSGQTPSFTRQLSDEITQQQARAADIEHERQVVELKKAGYNVG